jgi:hypothetical protein
MHKFLSVVATAFHDPQELPRFPSRFHPSNINKIHLNDAHA